MADEMGREDESAASSLVAYGANGGADPPAASITLVAAKAYVSASAKAAAQGPDDDGTGPGKNDKRSSPRSSPERDG